MIILVGAFALSGSNNATPTVTPTALPVTVTPTPVPSGAPTGASTATPTVVAVTPTPTPTVTPTTEPESGVKLTEFGYWITYPPLGPETWSDPKPAPANPNKIYFDPTEVTLSPENLYRPGSLSDDDYAVTHIYREGDVNCTAVVKLHATSSSNIVVNDMYAEGTAATPDYMYYVHGDDDVFTQVGENDYEVVFAPNVTDEYVHVHVSYYFDDSDTIVKKAPEGWIKLSITDGAGYSVTAGDFNVDIKDVPT